MYKPSSNIECDVVGQCVVCVVSMDHQHLHHSHGHDCVAFNHQSVTSTCELLDSYLCESETTQLSPQPNWQYYDLINTQRLEEEQLFQQHDICSDFGHCSHLCARGVGEQCRSNLQCNLTVTTGSHCTANDGTTIGQCVCETDHWAYNSTHCIHTYSMSGMTWEWTTKKIVNDMCSVTFTAKSTSSLHFLLMTKEDFISGVTYYRIELDATSSRINRYNTESVRHDGTILTGNFQNFTMSWCSGRVTVAIQGQAPFLDWTDPSPLTIHGLAFYAPSSPDNHLFFPHNVIDSYFPLNLETGIKLIQIIMWSTLYPAVHFIVMRTNGHFWRLVKIFPDGSSTTSLTITFSVMALRNCRVLLTNLNDNSKQFQVGIGMTPDDVWIYDGHTWVTQVSSPSPLSTTEFRSFWITLDASTIMCGKEGNDTAIASYTDSVNIRSFTHVGVITHHGDLGYWKMTSLPQFQYPAGTYYL
ncbi:hypothetical protein Pmani_033477 [Petrolisthes manimaculis]|uniref:Farnesoic acid O-methyl transferase domain-containing protein n=1 Tax=Petrolisthes manimaculis TaxID=1843537 RepID=A0AAE1TSL2_9EUCA|nr:hypothetical protein Pmani_033477 [Petrolisthes manimaculis]